MENIVAEIFNGLDGSKWSRCVARTPESGDCVDCLRRQYYDGNQVSYDCVEKRKLYVLRYLPVHAAENRAGLRRVTAGAVEKILEYAPIRILSMGGGPGSDIHAVLEFLRVEIEDVSEHRVFITRIDVEPLWDEIAENIIKDAAGELSIQLDTLHEDVIDGLDMLKNDDEDFDIALCSYLISELNETDLQELGQKLREVMWDGGIIIINDRPEAEVKEKIRMVFEAANVDYLEATNSGWGGFVYDDEVAQKVSPKFKMNSVVFWGVKHDN